MTQNQSIAEQRQHRRIGCRVSSWLKDLDSPFKAAKVEIQDISEGGVRFISSKPLSLDSEILIQLKVGSKKIETIVQPAWVSPSLRKGFQVGARFLTMPPLDKFLVQEYITGKL